MATASALVLGDLCADTIVTSRLPLTWRESADSGESVFRVAIGEQVGGSAFHFARHAAAAGMDPLILGAVGSDLAGDRIVARLAEEALSYRVQRSDTAATAQSIIAYDASGTRLMITSQPSANDELSAEFLRANIPPLLRPDVVWLPGHCLRDRSAARWSAVKEVLAYGRDRSARVVLDIVPHDLYRLFPGLDELQSAVGTVDGISSDLDSIRHWIYTGDANEPPSPQRLAAVVADALELIPFVMLRYHDGRTYRQLAAARTGFRAAETRTVPDGERLSGYGDFLACTALRGYLEHLAGSAGTSGPAISAERGVNDALSRHPDRN